MTGCKFSEKNSLTIDVFLESWREKGIAQTQLSALSLICKGCEGEG